MSVPIVIANPKKKRTPPRNKDGTFRKRAATTPAKSRGTHPRQMDGGTSPSKPRKGKKRSATRGEHPTGKTTAIVRSAGGKIRRRRANPIRLGSMMAWAGMAVAALGGILAAKVISNLWKQYVSPMVRGTGLADWRAWLDDFLRIVAMEAGVWMLGKALTKYLRMEAAGKVVFATGTGETLRQLLGAVVRNVSPGTDRAAVGLDGPGGGEFKADDDGVVYLRNAAGEYEPIGALGGPNGQDFYTIDEIREMEAEAA